MTGDLWAGAEVQLFETLTHMPETIKDTISVVLFSNGELAKRLLENNINVSVIDEDIENSIFIIKRLGYYINTNSPDIMHVHDYKSHVITSIAIYNSMKNPRVIRTLHGLKVVPKTIKMLKSYVLSIVENYLLRYKTDCIIAVSMDIEKLIKKKYKGVRVEQINNAISIPDKKEEHIKQIREKYHVGINDLWIATASRLVDIKNVKMLIDSIAKINAADVEGIVVSIFGDGPLRKDLEQRIVRYKLNNTITMHGHNQNIVEIMPAFDIFVNTSVHEGLPMSVLEAMARGVLPLCTRVGGMKEIIEHSKNGMTVELNDNCALADTIVYLKNNKSVRKKIGVEARKQIIDNYNIKKSVNMLNGLYTSLLEDSGWQQ